MNHVPEKQETPKALKSTLNHSIPKDDQRRQKRWAPRMKTGCTTCRVRRIKCDETKPVCIRCQKSKRVCERLHAPQTLPSVRLASDWHNHSRASSHPLYNPGFIPVEDLDLYDYLRSKTIKQITAGVIQEFWNVDFLRANLQSKALWHAGLALAAMYRHKDAPDQHSSLNFYTSSLNHYNHAMIHVIRLGSMKNPSWVDKEVLLVASMLFTCICILANDEGASIVHLINGIRLFYNWRFWDVVGNHDSRLFDHKTLTLFITYFELDFPDQNEWALLSEDRYSKSPTLCSRNPSTSIDDLYGELLDIYHYSLSWSTRQSLSLGVSESAVNVLNREANIWETKVKVFKSSVYFHHSVTSALTILELLHTQMTIGFGAAGKRHDANFIMNHQLQYASLIDRAEHYMKTKSMSQNGIVFTMSLREIFSSVAKLCYRGDIRRKSIALLRICPQRDGCWDNNLSASVLEHIMNMEEAGIDDPDNEGGCSCVRNLYICGEHSEQEFCRDVVFVGGFADITLQTRKAYKLKRPPYRARVQL